MPKALLSVHDKTHLEVLAKGLVDCGWTLLASGSTAQFLRQHDLAVEEVADYTASPEMLGGRVKTLHPAIHASILARDTAEDHAELINRHWDYIDLVAVNLYPFTQVIKAADVTLATAIENIDIGGVALLRAAAKNFQRVTVLADPADYPAVLQQIKTNQLTQDFRKKLAVKAFALTNQYDQAITNYLAETETKTITLYPQTTLRYGENPHQTASLYSLTPNSGPLGGELLQGKALSYNNLLDLDAAFKSVVGFSEPAIAIIKHVSPCGVATDVNLVDAFKKALKADPVSAFGGVIAANKMIDADLVTALGDLFVECIIAPGYTEAALALLAKRSQCRLVKLENFCSQAGDELRTIHQGILVQALDNGDPSDADWRVVSEREPTAQEMLDLKFAWQVAQQVRSNAIVFAQHTATLGIGGGQPNRIDCVRMAAQRAGTITPGTVMASDAFFPFRDCVDLAASLGITAIIHPGGSKRDEESIAAANQANIAMVMTGVRHFKH